MPCNDNPTPPTLICRLSLYSLFIIGGGEREAWKETSEIRRPTLNTIVHVHSFPNPTVTYKPLYANKNRL
jgi:hypothetical protein